MYRARRPKDLPDGPFLPPSSDLVSTAARLAGFAAVLALVFAGAAFAGSRIDVHPGKPAPKAGKAAMGAMAHGDETMAPQPVRGLAVSENGLTLELARARAPPGKPFELAFRIVDRRGQTVRDFDVEHTKRMHFIVVRRDMTGFQHLHPTERPDGTWSVPVTLPDAGSYRVFADFSVDGKPLHARRRPHRRRLGALAARCPRPPRASTSTACASRLTEGATKAGAESELALHRHPRRPAGRRPGLPGRQGPPRGAAPGRPRLPARAPRREPPAVHGRRSRPRAATACSCSSRPPTAASTPPRSPRR